MHQVKEKILKIQPCKRVHNQNLDVKNILAGSSYNEHRWRCSSRLQNGMLVRGNACQNGRGWGMQVTTSWGKQGCCCSMYPKATWSKLGEGQESGMGCSYILRVGPVNNTSFG
jgi:hypothetical protein